MNLFERFKLGLTRTREATLNRLSSLLRHDRLDESVIEQLEEALLESDVGFQTTKDLIAVLKKPPTNNMGSDDQTPLLRLKDELFSILNVQDRKINRLSRIPWVMLLVGVNGTGKTTTAGKLAYHFCRQNKKVVIAAADTFRAAANEQLGEWARRSGARFISQRPGADPASVAYDAFNSAKARGEDVVIIDTAGRLQAKQNLMEELAKIRRVINRLDSNAPNETLLVIDATTGQNGLSQARAFLQVAGVTGLIVTKLDGTARGGIVVPIRRELDLPIEFIGLGEGIDDLQPFETKEFVNALFAE